MDNPFKQQYMYSYINNVAAQLRAVNDLLAGVGADGIGFDEAMVLGSFFKDFEETNRLIGEAEEMAVSDAEGLMKLAVQLIAETERFEGTGIDGLSTTDYEALFNAHIEPWKKRHEEAMSKATELWRRYSAMSNRLDYLPLDSAEYRELDAKCDAAKAEYDEAHERADQLYADLQGEERRCYCVYFFRPMFLGVLVARLKAIAESIVADLNHLNGQDI